MATGRLHRVEVTTRDPVRARLYEVDVTSEPRPRRRLYQLDVHTDVLLIANPGVDQTVDSAERVYLSGLASSGFPTWWSWSQTAGPAVTLQPDASSPTPSFIAPATDEGTVVSFALTVGNDEGDTSEVSGPVTITVRPQVEWAYVAGVWRPVLIEMFD